MPREEKTSIEKICLTEGISYVAASGSPLSSDVILIDGEEYLYLFDVGNNEEVAAYLDSLPKKKKVILSHFHEDHMGNIGRLRFEAVYAGTATEKHYSRYIPEYKQGQEPETYRTVTSPVTISDGVELKIYPVPSSHAKGCLLLQVNGEILFMGDALYPSTKNGKAVYNVQLLKEELRLLRELPGEQLFSSHEKRPLKAKKGVLRFLESLYEQREPKQSYIER